MKWRDYDLEHDREIDSWILPSYSENASLINKYAFFNETVSKQYLWYKEHPEEMSNIGDYFKVVEIDGEVMALLILNFSNEDGKFVSSINPIAVNPRYINNGYGTQFLKYLIENAEMILGQKVDVLYAGIDEHNILSRKVFEKLGFVEKGRSDDADFIYYFYDY